MILKNLYLQRTNYQVTTGVFHRIQPFLVYSLFKLKRNFQFFKANKIRHDCSVSRLGFSFVRKRVIPRVPAEVLPAKRTEITRT